MSTDCCAIGVGKLRKLSIAYLQDILLNLYNVQVKVAKTAFSSENELPTRQATDLNTAKSHICRRLSQVFPYHAKLEQKFEEICDEITESTCAQTLLEQLEKIGKEARQTIKTWGVENEMYIGVIPTPCSSSMFEATVDTELNRLYLHWNKQKLDQQLTGSVSKLLQILRDTKRQPSPVEYLAFQLAYDKLSNGTYENQEHARCLGTPGFRPYTQTYMSLTDPGDGHVFGTTRFNDWMKGAIVHVEHLERPRHLPRENIESYRIPSIYDFSKVRLHVGPNAPTTYFVGRRVKDSGNFNEDFLKTVNITAASGTAAFFQGAAECKVSMEGLSTSQAVRYMQALRGQVQRNRKQFLSAAWNLNQTIVDDYGQNTPKELKTRMEIATRAIEITCIGGFDKITWDGASDTYPSKCIMYQLSLPESLTIVHKAHEQGLVTYFSAGFKFNEIKLAVYAGVDGIGIGGAQVLRFMDSKTGMHGPYMEENIPTILKSRDEAAGSVRGRAVNALARLDTMHFEGSISEDQERLRDQLFAALLEEKESQIEYMMHVLKPISKMAEEGNDPLMGRAYRLIEASAPVLKLHCESIDTWKGFIKRLRNLVLTKDGNALAEEYDSDPWLCLRKKYRDSMNTGTTKPCFARQTSHDIQCRCFP